jgi:hypothetical protein
MVADIAREDGVCIGEGGVTAVMLIWIAWVIMDKEDEGVVEDAAMTVDTNTQEMRVGGELKGQCTATAVVVATIITQGVMHRLPGARVEEGEAFGMLSECGAA